MAKKKMKLYEAHVYLTNFPLKLKATGKRDAKKKLKAKVAAMDLSKQIDWQDTDMIEYKIY